MTEPHIVNVTKDEPITYQAHLIVDTPESINLAMQWLTGRTYDQLVDVAPPYTNLDSTVRQFIGSWMVKQSDSTMATLCRGGDFEADWTIVEDDPFESIVEQEFTMPELSPELRDRGEFQTEVIWQCFEVYRAGNPQEAQWWDAVDEDDALARSKAAGFPGKVRSRTQIIVTGPWKEQS